MIYLLTTLDSPTGISVARSLAVLLPLMSVFLGLLFTMRYHAFYENFDTMLVEAGVEGFTENQKNHLKLVRWVLFRAIGFFVATLLVWMVFGIPPVAESAWAYFLVCGGLFVLCTTLLSATMLDMRNGIARPWLRYQVMVLGAAGVIGSLIAIFGLEPDFWV